MRPTIEVRGERSQVECPDCDAWVVLLPAKSAAELALNAMDVAYPNATNTFASIVVFTNKCVCGAQITLTMTRSRGPDAHAHAQA